MVNTKIELGSTALLKAVANSHADTAALFINNGADVEAADGQG